MALVEADKPLELKDRWKVVDKMEMITQYTFAGDFTRMSRYLFLIDALLIQGSGSD